MRKTENNISVKIPLPDNHFFKMLSSHLSRFLPRKWNHSRRKIQTFGKRIYSGWFVPNYFVHAHNENPSRFELKCIRGNLIKERDEFLESIKKYELETTFDTNFYLVTKIPSEETVYQLDLKNLALVSILLAETYNIEDELYTERQFLELKQKIKDNSFRYIAE